MFFLPFAVAENPVEIYDGDIEVVAWLDSNDEGEFKKPQKLGGTYGYRTDKIKD